MPGPDEVSEARPGRGTGVVLVLEGPIAADDVPGLCDRLAGLLRHTGTGLATCDVGGVDDTSVATVDALARLQLAATRAGGRMRLRHASPRLRALLDLVGLADVIPCVPCGPAP